MNASTNPLIRPRNPFERRIIGAIEANKPRFGVGLYSRPLPGGVSQSYPRFRSKTTKLPFSINGAGKVQPGLVGGLVPTLGGEPINTTDNTINLTNYDGDFLVWFQINFSVTYDDNDFMKSFSLESVSIEAGSSISNDTDEEKNLLFNSVTDGRPSASYFTSSIYVALADNGENATTLVWALP